MRVANGSEEVGHSIQHGVIIDFVSHDIEKLLKVIVKRASLCTMSEVEYKSNSESSSGAPVLKTPEVEVYRVRDAHNECCLGGKA